MIIQRVVSDLLRSNMYVVIEGQRAIIIDPCRQTELPENVVPDMILLTHEHYDHISGVNVWKDRYGIPVLCSARCNDRIQNPKNNMSRYFEAFCRMQEEIDSLVPDDYEANYSCEADLVFEDTYGFSWMGHAIQMMTLPGHSPGSTGILVDNALFSGDSIFEHHDTALRFPGGSAREWREKSLPGIRQLPEDTIVYPGHFESFCLKEWQFFKEE